MGASDPALSYLKDFGYSVVRLPTAAIRPGMLYQRDGKDLNRLGKLTELFVPGAGPVPVITENIPAPDLKGTISTKLARGLGLTLLGSFLKGMSAGSVGLELSYQDAATIGFEFSGLLADQLDPLALEKFLVQAEVDPNAPHSAELLDHDEIYVLTATLKSKRFVVEGQSQNKKGLKLEVPVIQQIVGGNVTVGSEGAAGTKLSYEGTELLVFGYQAVQLIYDQGRFSAFKMAPAGETAVRKMVKGRAATKTGRKPRTARQRPRGGYLSAKGTFFRL